LKPCPLALALVLIATAAHAQPGEPASPPASEARPVAIPIGEIGAETEAVEVWTREVVSELRSGIEERIGGLLERSADELSKRQASLEEIPGGPAPGRALSAARAGWQQLDAELAAAQDDLERAADGLERRLREARERSARWALTAAEARGEGVPATVLAGVQHVRDRLAEVEARLERARNAILALEQRALQQRRSVDAGLERVAALRGELRRRLIERDEPPLWSLRPVANARSELSRLAETFGEVARDVRDYAAKNREPLFVQLGLIGLLIWAAVRGRPTLRRVCGEAEGASGVLAHPVAAGLLVGLAPVRVLNPDAPPGFTTLVGAFALGPWLRVLTGVLPPSLHAPLGWLAVLVLINFAREALGFLPLLPRVLLILELSLGAAVVASLRRRGRLALVAELGGGAWRRLLALWLRLSLLALLVGLPAAVLGYAELGNVLAGAPVLGSFIGTLLLVVVLVLELLLRALVESGSLDTVHAIRMHHRRLLRGASWLLRAGGVVAWLYLFLDFTTLGDPLWPWIARVLATPIGYGSVSLAPGGVLAFLFALWVSWLLARLLALMLESEVFPRLRMAPGVPFALATFTRYAVLATGFVIALGLIGFSLDRVTILIGALGVGLGFGLQNVVNNFVSGVILLFERPIRVGDRIQLDELVGDVTRIGMRSSRVRTLDGIDLIVPNADFVSARVANWTLSDQARRVNPPVGVAYGTPPERVLALLERVARAHPEVLPSPPPELLFRGFGESSLDFELRVWTDSRLLARVQSDLAVATYDALQEAGIEIPFPQRDLHLRSVSPQARGTPLDAPPD
jgi:small-conductance mechanosensitive channel